jgi:hypothetical protein
MYNIQGIQKKIGKQIRLILKIQIIVKNSIITHAQPIILNPSIVLGIKGINQCIYGKLEVKNNIEK